MTTQAAPARLTRRQEQVLIFITKYLDSHGYGPTVRDIMDNFGIGSPNGAMYHLHRLKAKGRINWTPNLSRSIQIVGRKRCPHCGRA